MTPGTERDLLRLLTGQLPAEEARALHLRMEEDAELARAYARLARSWQGLSLPEPAAAPPGFATRVLARARAERVEPALSWRAAPPAVRALAAAAVAVGMALGALGSGLALRDSPESRDFVDRLDGRSGGSGWPASLADSYWSAFDDGEPDGGDALAEPEPSELPQETDL